MEKKVHFCDTKFSSKVLQDATKTLLSKMSLLSKVSGTLVDKVSRTMTVKVTLTEEWEHDEEAEFFADYDKSIESSRYAISIFEPKLRLSVVLAEHGCTDVAVGALWRSDIEEIFAIFSEAAPRSKLDRPAKSHPPIVFIGHGRSPQWRDLKDHLHEKHGITVEAYEIGARAGLTITNILEDMLTKSSLALLVLTGEDLGVDGNHRARENVIHELGLFQGRLGFSRAIVLLEEGANEFSNLHGLQQIRFSKHGIKESFGDVLATIRREFPDKHGSATR